MTEKFETVLEIPVPVSQLVESKVASRTTLWRWEKLGLPILSVGGKRYVRPSQLNRFMDEQDAKARELATA